MRKKQAEAEQTARCLDLLAWVPEQHHESFNPAISYDSLLDLIGYR